MSRKTQL